MPQFDVGRIPGPEDEDPDEDPIETDVEVTRRRLVVALRHREYRWAAQVIPAAHAEEMAQTFRGLGYHVRLHPFARSWRPSVRAITIWPRWKRKVVDTERVEELGRMASERDSGDKWGRMWE